MRSRVFPNQGRLFPCHICFSGFFFLPFDIQVKSDKYNQHDGFRRQRTPDARRIREIAAVHQCVGQHIGIPGQTGKIHAEQQTAEYDKNTCRSPAHGVRASPYGSDAAEAAPRREQGKKQNQQHQSFRPVAALQKSAQNAETDGPQGHFPGRVFPAFNAAGQHEQQHAYQPGEHVCGLHNPERDMGPEKMQYARAGGNDHVQTENRSRHEYGVGKNGGQPGAQPAGGFLFENVGFVASQMNFICTQQHGYDEQRQEIVNDPEGQNCGKDIL